MAEPSTPAIEFLREHGSTPQETCRSLISRGNTAPFIPGYNGCIYLFQGPSRPHKKTSDRTKAGANASRGARADRPNPHRHPPAGRARPAPGSAPTPGPPGAVRPRLRRPNALESSPNRPRTVPEGSGQLPGRIPEGSRQDPAPDPTARARLELSALPERSGGFSPAMGRLARLPHPFLQKIG